jgi:hypothetical protein
MILRSGNEALGGDPMQQPNWIVVTIIGAVAGAIVSQYWSIIFYPVKLLKADALGGGWYDYHFTFVHGKRYLAESIVRVRRGILADRSVYVQDQDLVRYSGGIDPNRKDGLNYKGGIQVEGPHLIVKLRATSHRELLVFRLINRLPSNASIIPGVWMSFDHELNPTAGVMVLSRERMTSSDATTMLLEISRTDRGAVQVPLSERARRRSQ